MHASTLAYTFYSFLTVEQAVFRREMVEDTPPCCAGPCLLPSLVELVLLKQFLERAEGVSYIQPTHGSRDFTNDT